MDVRVFTIIKMEFLGVWSGGKVSQMLLSRRMQLSGQVNS